MSEQYSEQYTAEQLTEYIDNALIEDIVDDFKALMEICLEIEHNEEVKQKGE
jgi:hypothetical protein